MKTKFDTIEIQHDKKGTITEVIGDGTSLIGDHITHISYTATAERATLEMTFMIKAPRLIIKGVPEKNVMVDFDETHV